MLNTIIDRSVQRNVNRLKRFQSTDENVHIKFTFNLS